MLTRFTFRSPPALHGTWTLEALRAGKHVLVEKPFTANGREAVVVAEAAAELGLVVMEAFHPLYHPTFQRLRSLVRRGAIGEVHRVSAAYCAPIPPGRNIRWNEQLGGGALMDLGCYPLRLVQSLLGAVTEVKSAEAVPRSGVDRTMQATYVLGSTARARVAASLWSRRLFASTLQLRGSCGQIRLSWPYQPHAGAKITGTTLDGCLESTPVDRTPSYLHQLRAFREAVLYATPIMSGLSDSVAMMNTIDATYIKAGMSPRLPLPS